MITILNGKLTIPESERFIGFAGDNLARTIEFLLAGLKKADPIYRIYLTFDDGTVNHFVLPSEVTEDGVVLTWNVLREHIFKSGNVKVQIKAFSDKGVVYHTNSDTFIVGNSAEFSDHFGSKNSEFLQYEEMLNNFREDLKSICTLTPYIGDNGNWYIYDADKGAYVDSGRCSYNDGEVITVDQTFDAASENPQSGKAVAQAVAQGKTRIEEGAVKLSHLSEELLIPDDMLEGIYWENEAMLSVMSYAFLDELLTADRDKTGGMSKTIFRLGFIPSFPGYSILGSDEYIGITDTVSEKLLLVNLSSGEHYTYKKGSESVAKVNSSAEFQVDREFSPESDNAQSGKAVAQAVAGVKAQVEEGSVELKHLSEELLIPEGMLEGIYWENENMLSVMSYAFLDELLTTECNKTGGMSKTIFRLGFISSFPDYGILGSDEYIGITDTVSEKLLLVNLSKGAIFTYKKGDGCVYTVSSPEPYFEYAGTFDTEEKLINYKFREDNTMYMFRISGELYNTLGYSCLPSSGAMCIGYYYVTTPDINQGLMYQTVLPDGYSYSLNISNRQGVKHAIATSSYSSTGNTPVNGQAVAKALAPIYETLDGLEDLLAGI